jgi:hypothetical protein
MNLQENINRIKQVMGLLTEEYSDKVMNQLIEKFKQENPEMDEGVIRDYINRFDKIKNDPSIKDKDIFNYSLHKLEVILHSSFSNIKPKSYKGDEDLDLVYDKNDFRIYRADSHEKCIRYGKGYSFCISSYSDRGSYESYRVENNGTPYFVFNRNFSNKKKKSSSDEFETPEHLLVIIVYKNWGGPIKFAAGVKDKYVPSKNEGVYYSVSDANNEGERYYHHFENLENDYLSLSLSGANLKDILEPITISDKDYDISDLQIVAKQELSHVLNKYGVAPNEQSTPVFRDSCGVYLQAFYDLNDLSGLSVFKEPLLNHEYLTYKIKFNDPNDTFTRIEKINYGNDGYEKSKAQLEKIIETNLNAYRYEENRKEGSFLNPGSFEGSASIKKRKLDELRPYADINNYEILKCTWPDNYVSYLKAVYAIANKLAYKRWSFEKE